MSSKVVLHNVGFSYLHTYPHKSSFEIDASLEVEPNRVTCLLGSSGSGKTTILILIAGLLSPERGSIHVDEVLVSSAGYVLDTHDRNICVVFQTPSLLPHRTALENIIFAMRLNKRSDEKLGEALEFLAQVNMLEYAYKYPYELSMGQQQRVSLARAFASGAGIMLLDEPFSNLDVENSEQVKECLWHLISRYSRTIILVTHSATEAMLLGDYVYIIDKGRVAQSGAPREIYDNPCSPFVARFFSPINSIVTNTNDEGEPMLPFVVPIKSNFISKKVEVCIRYESILFSSHEVPGSTKATVIDVRFFATYDLIKLVFPCGCVISAYHGSHSKLHVGGVVYVALDQSSVIVFDYKE